MKRTQAGFTLIELMISLVLFSVAIAGMLSVAVTMTRSFREQRRVVETEQAVRSPLDYIVDSLRQASPGVKTGNIHDADTCATGSLMFTDSSTGPDILEAVIASGGIVSTAHTAVISSSTSLTLPAAHAPQFAVDDFVLISNVTQGTLTKVTAVTATTLGFAASPCTGGADAFPVGGYAVNALLVRAQRAQFYVGTLNSIPTLYMDPDGPLGAGAAEPIAEGIEDMQIAFAVDTNSDGQISEVGAAAGDDEWTGNVGTEVLPAGSIRAVRVVLVARDTSELQGDASFTQPSVMNHIVSPTLDKYRRRVLTSTVEIRNLTGSP